MKIVIEIPEEQVKKSLEESKYINKDEGEKGSVHISMLYTNAQIEFVDVVRKTDFYSCEYKILPKGHGRLIDGDKAIADFTNYGINHMWDATDLPEIIDESPIIIEADTEVDYES